MDPTPPDQSDRLLAPHNPSVVGSILTGPTKLPDADVILIDQMAKRDVATGQRRQSEEPSHQFQLLPSL
jgi:hypothetical protein